MFVNCTDTIVLHVNVLALFITCNYIFKILCNKTKYKQIWFDEDNTIQISTSYFQFLTLNVIVLTFLLHVIQNLKMFFKDTQVQIRPRQCRSSKYIVFSNSNLTCSSTYSCYYQAKTAQVSIPYFCNLTCNSTYSLLHQHYSSQYTVLTSLSLTRNCTSTVYYPQIKQMH